MKQIVKLGIEQLIADEENVLVQIDAEIERIADDEVTEANASAVDNLIEGAWYIKERLKVLRFYRDNR